MPNIVQFIGGVVEIQISQPHLKAYTFYKPVKLNLKLFSEAEVLNSHFLLEESDCTIPESLNF
jgi:hypothetical protein